METRTKSSPLPRIRDNLTIQAVSATEYVVKRNDSREYFSLGPQEACLLRLLDGQHSVSDIQISFQREFDAELSEDDLQEFYRCRPPNGSVSIRARQR